MISVQSGIHTHGKVAQRNVGFYVGAFVWKATAQAFNNKTKRAVILQDAAHNTNIQHYLEGPLVLQIPMNNINLPFQNDILKIINAIRRGREWPMRLSLFEMNNKSFG